MEITRLDIFVFSELKSRKSPLGVSREKAIHLIKQGYVTVNGCKVLQPSRKISPNVDRVVIKEPLGIKNNDTNKMVIPSMSRKLIVHENSLFMCINKPTAMVVHPGAGKEMETVLSRFGNSSEFNILNKVQSGIVHRIDKETSGCLMFSKDPNFSSYLAQQFQERRVIKYYVAITPKSQQLNALGVIPSPNRSVKISKLSDFVNQNLINILEDIEHKSSHVSMTSRLSSYFYAKLGRLVKLTDGYGIGGWVYRDSRQGYKFSLEYPKSFVSSPKSAVTMIFPIAEANNSVVWLVKILTGRTHQIRTVMKFLDMPIVGDTKYSSKAARALKGALNIKRMMLHAFYIKFSITAPFIDRLKDLVPSNLWERSNSGASKILQEEGRIEFAFTANI